MHILPAIGVVALIVGAVGTLCFYAMREQTALNDGFQSLDARAHSAKTRIELEGVKTDLYTFYRKQCWHRAHGERAKAIMSYINGRLTGVTS